MNGLLAMQRIGVTPPPKSVLLLGGIVGSVQIIACVNDSPSKWFSGPCGLLLYNPEPLKFMACRGSRKFFNVNYK
jgi:hypothetical protein